MTRTKYNIMLKQRANAILKHLGYDIKKAKWYLINFKGERTIRRKVAYFGEYWLKTDDNPDNPYVFEVGRYDNHDWYLLIMKKEERVYRMLYGKKFIGKYRLDLQLSAEENVILGDMEAL